MDLVKLADSFKRQNSSEHLQLLAKRAVGRFVSKESSNLTQAVTESVQGEGLNKDQLRRVSEMANQAAWKETFSEDRQVHFEPANQDAVIESFSEKAPEAAPVNADYLMEPPKDDVGAVDLHEAFGVSAADESPYPSVNPVRSQQEGVEKAAAARGLTQHALRTAERELPEAVEDFYRQVKQAHLMEGHALTKIAKAVARVTGPEFSKRVMTAATKRLVKGEGVRPSRAKEKLASVEDVIVNTDHSLLHSAVRLEKLARSVAHARQQSRDTEHAYSHAVRSLKQTAR